MGRGFKVMIEGDYACFTRPEMKTERVSYDVPTPGAIEGLLKSIYWKPSIRYVVDKIIVFEPVRFISIKRNEVSDKVSEEKIKKQMKGKEADSYIYTSECINQRTSMILKNVKYGIQFHFELTGLRNEREKNGESKHYNIIKRRLEKGQYFRTPCLGCSEFPAKKIELVEKFDRTQIKQELIESGDTDLGFMLYRMNFKDKGIPLNNDWNSPKFSDAADAVFYKPHMVKGEIDVKKYREEMTC